MEMPLEHKNQDTMPQAFQRESQSSLAYPSRTIVHAKLEMTEPGDHDEQEADAVANAIVSGGKIARKISGGGGSSGIAVSQQMESQLSQLQGGGRQMPEGLRNMMESGFGQDFSQVRLHTDSEAANVSSSIHAKAFTHGNDIYFNQGQFSPNTTEGQRLMAHELTHVVQGTGKVGRWNMDDPRADLFGQTVVGAPDLSNVKPPQSEEDILRKGYEELKKHGILFAISENVYEFSSEYVKDPEAFKKSGKLSENEIAWLNKVEKHLGKVKKGSHVFAFVSKTLTFIDACKLVYKAKFAMSRNASGLQQAEFATDAGFFFIGLVGGIPGAVFTTSYQYIVNTIGDYVNNHPRETKAGIFDFFGIPGSFDIYLDPMRYINN